MSRVRTSLAQSACCMQPASGRRHRRGGEPFPHPAIRHRYPSGCALPVPPCGAAAAGSPFRASLRDGFANLDATSTRQGSAPAGKTGRTRRRSRGGQQSGQHVHGRGFPAPLGRRRAKMVPSGTCRLMPSSTTLSPKDLRSPVAVNCFHEVFWAPPHEAELAPPGQFQLLVAPPCLGRNLLQLP